MFKKTIKFLATIALSFVLGVFISRNSYSRVEVSGHSMDYTLKDGEKLWVNNLPFKEYKLNDIVVANESGVRVVKRIVGLPNDRLIFVGDTLYRNGKAVEEGYVTDEGYEKGLLKAEITVPEGEYFLLGDNRDVSNDSRYFGTVTKSQLQGKVIGIE